MVKGLLASILGGVVLLATAGRASAITVSVDPSATWLGYMNVFELPENGGAFVYGEPWGIPDLTATFSGPVLTLGPNSVNDPNPYWYTPSGGPGSTGNKNMEANMYVEDSVALVGQTVTFTGFVQANTLVEPYTSVAFIKDFSPSYSSFNTITVPLAPGPFSITLETLAEEGRHVQYGFATTGPNVWITDVGPKGNVQVTASAPLDPADFNEDGFVDGLDLTAWKAAFGQTPAGDADNDNDSDGADFLIWQRNFAPAAAGAAVGAVPEPSTAILLVVGMTIIGRRGLQKLARS